MALNTLSIFYYGYSVNKDNRYINFEENGGGELTAELEIGSFTLTEILVIIKTAMDAVGNNTYTVTVDRDTRIITITSDGTFSLLLSTGVHAGSSPFSLLGFTSGSDTLDSASHSGDDASGFSYTPQFILQDFISSDNWQESIDSSVNESATGDLEVVNYGVRLFTQFSLKFINSLPQDNIVIRNNPSGLADAQAFLQEITTKNPIEVMYDINSRDTYKKLVLDKTPSSSSGTAYKLNELTGQSLPGYYEINSLKFRVFAS